MAEPANAHEWDPSVISGVGKTTLITEMSAVLREAQIAHAGVDFDGLTVCYPRPADDDRWGTRIGFEICPRSGRTIVSAAPVTYSLRG